MDPRNLYLTDAQFEDLWARYDKTQSTTKNVTVPKEALFSLLRDHSTMYGEVIEGPRRSHTQQKGKA